jgi:hypothetical protein
MTGLLRLLGLLLVVNILLSITLSKQLLVPAMQLLVPAMQALAHLMQPPVLPPLLLLKVLLKLQEIKP